MYKPRVIHIMDPGLTEIGGHYFSQNSAIVKAANSAGIPVLTYCRANAQFEDLEMKYEKVFTHDVFYEISSSNPELAVFQNFFSINRVFFNDLIRIPTSNFHRDDLIYFPGLTQNQLDAVTDWLVTISLESRPNVAITLRFLNSRMHYNLNRGYEGKIEFLYGSALQKLLERHPRTKLITDTKMLSDCFKIISGINVFILPVPQGGLGSFNNISHQKKSILNILYIGNISPYRGHYFLNEIITYCLNKFSNIEFTIQIKADPCSADAQGITSISAQHREKSRFLFGTLPQDEYIQTLRDSDIVILPYMPSYYSFGSSGVFTEAASLGKVIVVTSGTVIDIIAEDFKLPVVFSKEYSAESFCLAICNAINNFDILEKVARYQSPNFSKITSP